MLLLFVDIAALVLFVMVAEVFVFFKLYEDAFFLPFAFLFLLAVLLYKKLDSIEQAVSEERRARAEYAERKRIVVLGVTLALLFACTMVVYTFWRRSGGELKNPVAESARIAVDIKSTQQGILDINKRQAEALDKTLSGINECAGKLTSASDKLQAMMGKMDVIGDATQEVADRQVQATIEEGNANRDLLAEIKAMNKNLKELAEALRARE